MCKLVFAEFAALKQITDDGDVLRHAAWYIQFLFAVCFAVNLRFSNSGVVLCGKYC